MKAESRSRIHWPRDGVAVRVPPRRLSTGDPSCEVIAFSGRAAQPSRTVAWSALATALPRGSKLVLLMAAEDVAFVAASVPNLTGMRLREALPNLVEERTVGDAGTVHVALGARAEGAEAKAGGARTLAVVDRTWLAAVQVHVVRSGHRVAAIVPESLAVPHDPTHWSLGAAGGDAALPVRAWLRTGPQAAIALPEDGEGASAVIRAALRGDQRPLRLDLVAGSGARATLATIGRAATDATQVPHATTEADPFAAWLAGGGPDGAYGPPLSMLSIDTGSGDAGAGWRRWRIAAALAVLLVGVQVAGLQWEWAGLRRESNALRQEQSATLTQAFPDTKVVLDAPLQMSRGLATLRASAGSTDPADFGTMVAAVARIFATLPSNALRGMDYEGRVMRLKIAPGAAAGTDQQQQLVMRAQQEGYVLRFESTGGTGDLVASLRTRGAGS